MGRPNKGLEEADSRPTPRAKKTTMSVRYRPGVKTYLCMYIEVGAGWAGKRCYDSRRDFERDASIEE